MKRRFLTIALLLTILILFSGCKKHLQKNQLVAMDGMWNVTSLKYELEDDAGNFHGDTTFYDAGTFEFRSFSRKEIKAYEKAETSADGENGYVIFRMNYVPSIDHFYKPGETIGYDYYEDFIINRTESWQCEQVIGFKPTFHFGKRKAEVLEYKTEKQVWRLDPGFTGGGGYMIYLTITLERL